MNKKYLVSIGSAVSLICIYTQGVVSANELATRVLPKEQSQSLEQQLEVAILDKNTVQVHTLIAAGVDINTKIKNGLSPLHLAARSGSLELVQILVSKGAIVDALDNLRATPLMLAAQGGCIEVAKFLVVECHANINARNRYGETPLGYIWQIVQDYQPIIQAYQPITPDSHLYVDQKQLTVIQFLINNGGTL